MVKLNRIYTKTGDAGVTGLGDGRRVEKDHLRVEAYGTVDEANACVGVCVTLCDQAAPGTLKHRIGDLLRSSQHDLFDVGADLCCPPVEGEQPGQRLRVSESQTTRLEAAIDGFNADLKPLNSFVLPGGSELASAMHVARTVVRRAERCVVALSRAEPALTNAECVRYLNRLSDLLFVLSRVANDNGAGDILWVPGQNRPK